MLIYVNNFFLKGEDATERALQSVCGWIKRKTNENFNVSMLKNGDNHKYGSITVRTFCAVAMHPQMYSILLTHPDNEVNGRFWETEIGIKEEDGKTKLSILLKVNDISTQVRGNVISTRPLLVKYLLDSNLLSQDTIGLKPKLIGNGKDDIRGLKWEIFRPERDYPLVIVSHNKNIHTYWLQQQLIGLAQVVSLPQDIDDGLMELELGQRYSSWDGAVNIIQPLRGGETPRNKIVLSDTIEQWKVDNVHILRELLSLVTHTTNGRYRREHFSPTDVRAKRQKDHRLALIKKVKSLNDDSGYKELLEEAMSEIDRMQEASSAEIESLWTLITDAESSFDEAEANKALLENDLLNLRAKNEYLETRIDEKNIGLPCLVKGREVDLYEGEITGVLIDALKPACDSAKQFSRRKHILEDILEHNPQSEAKVKFFEELKVELKDYRSVTHKLRGIFSKANIEVITEGSHNKVKFIGEERYGVTFAKTASDANAGKNNVATIKENLF